MMADINWMFSKEIALLFAFLTMYKNACFYTPLATQRVIKPPPTKTFSSVLPRLLVTSLLPLNRFLDRKLLKMHSLRDLKVKTGNSDEALRQGS